MCNVEYVLCLFAKRDWLCSTCLDKAASIDPIQPLLEPRMIRRMSASSSNTVGGAVVGRLGVIDAGGGAGCSRSISCCAASVRDRPSLSSSVALVLPCMRSEQSAVCDRQLLS